MTKVNSLLAERFKKATEKLGKMTGLAELSSSGNLSSFSGVFRVAPLSEKEFASLHSLLQEYSLEDANIEQDLSMLSAITSEVKAISNQAAILHGERIKKVQVILKNYQDGAFTAWLLGTYGNRQTPYNFLQYYELYITLPPALLPKLDLMPRQAVYTLASRKGPQEDKEKIINAYAGEAKTEVLALIRNTFPLSESDKRKGDPAALSIQQLAKLIKDYQGISKSVNAEQKSALLKLIKDFEKLVK